MVSTYFEVKMKYQFGEMPRIECESRSHTEDRVALGIHGDGGGQFYARSGHTCSDGWRKGDVFVVCADFAMFLRDLLTEYEQLQCSACGQLLLWEDFTRVIGEVGK